MIIKHLRIGHRLGAGFGLIIFFMIAVTAIGAFHLFQSKQRLAFIVDKQYPQTVLLSTIKDDFTASVGNMRNIIIINNPQASGKDVALMEQSNDFIEENSAKLDKMMAGVADARADLDNLKLRRATFKSSQQRFVKLVDEGDMGRAKELMLAEMKSYVEFYVEAVDRLIERQRKLVEAAGEEAETATRKALVAMSVLASLACGAGIAIALLVSRGIVGPLGDAVQMARQVADGDLSAVIEGACGDEIGTLMLSLKEMNQGLGRIVGAVRESSDNIAVASSQIAAGTLQLSARTEQQASALRETATSVDQLNATVRKNADSAAYASELGVSATSAAMKGGDVVSQVIATMGLIKDSSRRIGDIIGVIDGIAFQTNILALNAAVEAARAGDNGRGFAVVAAEVRNLAQRSAAAAREIKVLIGDSVEKVDAGNALVGLAGNTMDDIVLSVRKVAEIMHRITAASKEQSVGIASLSRGVIQMDELTRQNAALVEQATAATASMTQQAGALARSVGIFKLLAGPADPLDPAPRESAVPAPAMRTMLPQPS